MAEPSSGWATWPTSPEYGKISNTLGYYWSAVVGVKVSITVGGEFSLSIPLKFAYVMGPSISWTLGVYWAWYQGWYYARISASYSQTIGTNTFKRYGGQEFTIGGKSLGGITAAAAAQAATGYASKKVKFEMYYGSTYKWIKGGKFEREAFVGEDQDQAVKFVNDTGSKTTLAQRLEHFVTAKKTADTQSAALSDANKKSAIIIDATAATFASPAVNFSAAASAGVQAGLGTFNVAAKTRTATIGTAVDVGNCTETVSGTKSVIAGTGTSAKLEMKTSSAILVAGSSGIKATPAMVTIGPKVSLGDPVPPPPGQQAAATVDLNKALQDGQDALNQLQSDLSNLEDQVENLPPTSVTNVLMLFAV